MSFGIALTREENKTYTIRNRVSYFAFCFYFFAGLIFASSAYAATEFTAIVDPGNGAGTDFTSLSAWESSTQVDLTSAATKVFSISSASGTFAVGGNLTGETSLATASSTYRTATQVLIYNISGAFQSGETVYVTGQATSSNYVILSNTGDSAIAVASVRSSNGAADTSNFSIDGWTTASTTYIKIWTDPTTGARHNGKWDDTKYRMEVSSTGIALNNYEAYAWVDGLQISVNNTSDYHRPLNTEGQAGVANEFKASNNILKLVQSTQATYSEGLTLAANIDTASVAKIWNNIVYDITGTSNGRSIFINDSNWTVYVYNNTIINGTAGIEISSGSVIAKNNIVKGSGNTNAYVGTFASGTDYNATDGTDSIGTGSSNRTSQTFTFIDEANDDFHLSPSDTGARNWATSSVLTDSNLSFSQDIDGSYRGAAWDIGADEVPTELVSTICESTSAGGDCANRDYVTLSAWEAAVDSNLTASGTRLFSGTASGTLASAASVTLYDSSGASTGITGTINATTTNQIMIINILGTSSPVSVASGTSWRINSSNTWRVAGTADQLGASPIAVAKIDGAWTSADTTNFGISGWTTSYDNYIKIYTTPAARHTGKWDTGKYRTNVASGPEIQNREDNVWIDGLQFYGEVLLGTTGITSNANVRFSNNIITSDILIVDSGASAGNFRIWNNLVYDNPSSYACMYLYGTAYVYNNTLYNCSAQGIRSISNGVTAINNLVASTSDPFLGTFVSGTDYNATDINDTPGVGSNNRVNQTFSFLDAANNDFHLADTDTAAKGQGTNLTNDPWIPASAGMTGVWTDIDGASRPVSTSIGLNWDIGADQTAVKIYRSIAPSATAALTTGASNAATISSSTSLATFATALADNIGVGDVIIYNTGGTATATAFIHGRASSTQYTVKTASGTLPTAITSDTSWSIYRAYTSLANAESGSENTGIANATIRNFDAWSGGANLVASNTQWNIAAYANGTTADTAAVTIDGWTTGAQNFIKIYTPTALSEVGTSQRHQGKWDDNKYKIVNNMNAIDLMDTNYTWIEGIQIDVNPSNSSSYSAIEVSHQISTVSNNILKSTAAGDASRGIYNVKYSKIYNNIIYGFGWHGIYAKGESYFYNNTLYGNYKGIICTSGNYNYLKNNLAFNNEVADYSEDACQFDSSSANNLGEDADFGSVGYVQTSQGATEMFIDSSNYNFHINSGSDAFDAGTNLSADANLAFTDDIDGNYRRQWDIGADEGSVEYVTSVMQSGGNFSTLSAWEAANQVDLTATTTAVFSLSSASGTIPANSSIVGLTSSAVASTTVGSVSTSTQILLYNIASSTFISGERIYIKGSATTSNYAILGNAGNPAIATAKIDGAWASADASTVSISGWTTGPNNYVRVYATPTARHNGKWDDGKYRLVNNSTLMSLNVDYVRVEGLQLYHTDIANSYSYGIRMDAVSAANDIRIFYNIIRGGNSPATLRERYTGISIFNTNAVVRMWNNIIYDWASSGNPTGTGGINSAYSTMAYAYNNTLYNNRIGLRRSTGTVIAKNNIANGNTEDYVGSFDTSSANNISSDVTSPNSGGTDCGGHSCRNQTVSFVDAANNDFHLSPSDTVAKDAGLNLATDSVLPFSTDIEGDTRGNGLGWDIGADEGAVQIFRSVGPSATSALATGASNSMTVASASSLASFSVAISNNIGVGDVIQYDPANGATPTVVVFISGRTDSTHFTVKTATGSIPIATTTGNTNWSIYRAYTSLYNAERGNENDSLENTLEDFDNWDGTGDYTDTNEVGRDIAAYNEQWNIAAYANGTTADSTAVIIEGWTTGAQNYIKVYTPVNTSEVGTSQRHQGKWDDNKYKLEVSDASNLIYISEEYVRIEGLQTKHSYTTGYPHTIQIGTNSTSSDLRISSNILRGNFAGLPSDNWAYAIDILCANSAVAKIWNNIVYDYNEANANNAAFRFCGNAGVQKWFYVYNNTVYNTRLGFYQDGDSNTYIVKNNIYQSNGLVGANGYSGTAFDAASDYNISDLASDAPGTNSKNSTTVSFIDAVNKDFHLAPTDRAARDAGVSLANDVYLPFAVDIDGGARPQGPAWDIGADEATPVPDYRFRGDFKFRGIFKFR